MYGNHTKKPWTKRGAAQDDVSTKRWIYLDVCKIMAIFFVIVMHVSSSAWGASSVGSFNWHVLNVFNSLSRFCIPLFFMQTGALFLNEAKKMPVRTFNLQYTLRIVTAFLFWSTVNTVLYYLLDAPGGFGDFTLLGFVDSVLRGAEYVQWFILLAISVYLVVPILQAIANDINVCRYFLILWAIFSIALPLLYQIPYLFGQLPAFLQQLITWLTESAERVLPRMVTDFAGYMLLGHYIHVHAFKPGSKRVFAVVGVASFLATVLLTIYVSIRDGSPSEAFLGNFTPNVCLMAISFMVVAKESLESKWFKTRTYAAIRFFSLVSFGIFLIHDFLRQGLERLGFGTLSFSPLFTVPVLTVAIFMASALLAYAIYRIPKVGSYIV